VPTVGEQLRQAREARKLRIEDVAEETKIRGDHLRALEDGNYSIFSAPVYIRGFVRTYATLLKLDTAQILEQLGRELADSGRVDPTLAPRDKSLLDVAMFQLAKLSRRLVWPLVATVVALLLLAGGFYWWKQSQHGDPTRGLSSGLYDMPANSGDTLPVPPPPR
jgi:cytoskeletal protein RodZ